MKKHICIFLAALCLLLPACASSVTIPEEQPVVVRETLPPETTQPPTQPEHSSLYCSEISVEDLIRYFEEVCLDAEFIDSGNPRVLQKWRIPICYTLYGNYTQEDLAVLAGFSDWLNTLEGFPGIRPARDGDIETLRIYFCDAAELVNRMGGQFLDRDGAVRFWYECDEIYDAVICCRSDIDQTIRNSVLLEELYNGLGPVQDTSLRPDSIIYSEYSVPQQLTREDELILRLLYHPDMRCGMDAAQCASVIRQLYY